MNVRCSPWEFEGLVQRNLGMNCGLDHAGLGEFMRCTAQRSLAHLHICQLQGQGQQHAQLGDTKQPHCRQGDNPCRPCRSPRPACCVHHAMRLQRAGLVLSTLLGEQQRIVEACLAACAAQQGAGNAGLEGGEGGTQGLRSKHARPPQNADQKFHQEHQILLNRECLRELTEALLGTRFPRAASCLVQGEHTLQVL